MKHYDKTQKKLGQATVEEMDAMDDSELKRVIVEANGAMRTVAEELEANDEYQQLKLKVSDMSAGKREVDARQKARISYSLTRLEQMGKFDLTALRTWRDNREAYITKKAKADEKAAQEEAAE
jgi:hypothetical protein